ncbi:sulfurtransferase TusA family protein [Methylomusa anaerophila]|uniref:UPF0033 domain-containing protein n=2 Tax=Methylomusa anaerophila TaxID=1930071 RepID=A0A348ALH8_9FIRM|nr:sulfurtransferase TusA family protein [Methylomusa anaerophila]BBB91926.1 hypothetical protein MAMMFC1_02611 [Methylomusa anaerophila]
MSDKRADALIDITDVVCPVTFVKTLVALEELADGKILEIIMNDGEPILNVPRSLKDEGHKVIKAEKRDNGTYSVLVEKGSLK